MGLSGTEKIKIIINNLKQVDTFSAEFSSQIQNITDKHKTSGVYLEYAYIKHFHNEIIGLSKLFQYLIEDTNNKRYIFFPVRASLEILLYLEHVLKLAKQDQKLVLDLLSRDMAQSVASLNAAAPADQNHLMHVTIKEIELVNKILKTDFDLTKIKPNSSVFPKIRSLCDNSSLKLKDSYGSDIYHIYVIYSESSHLRLSGSAPKDIDTEICFALEYFIEIYIKFYEQILNTDLFDKKYSDDLRIIKIPLGLP